MQKLQFEPETLEKLLGVGKIRYMSVAILENQQQVLRIDCEEQENEYKTVRASKPAKPRQAKNTPDNHRPMNKSLQFDREVPTPRTSFGEKAFGVASDFGKDAFKWLRTPPKRKFGD